MLHNVSVQGWGLNTAWCVPTALSMITGIPLAHAHSRAAFVQGKALKDVKGVDNESATFLFREQGYYLQKIDLEARFPTPVSISKFMKEGRTDFEKCIPMYLVIKTNRGSHAICAHFDYVGDNRTMKPVPTETFWAKNKLVLEAHKIMKGT